MAVSICDPGAGRGIKEDQDFEAVGGLHYLGKSLFQKTKKKKRNRRKMKNIYTDWMEMKAEIEKRASQTQ